MEWLADPHAWLGLATLIVLEIVLGIDNLVFIAILADKLPPSQRNKARMLGLSLALIMRLILLATIYWIANEATETLFSVGDLDFSTRDLIMLFGGVFLLAKGTMELHERLEGGEHTANENPKHAVFWQVIVQIVVMDAVFSLDSVITAVGMVEHESVMMIAVIVAMGVMMLASKPLMDFVNRHPTVVILCLGFLMMIGFSLVVEGFGFHVPKGYLYAAIGFSILIEAFNQIGRHNREKMVTPYDLRSRTANAVLRLLGGGRGDGNLGDTVDVIAEQAAASEVFRPEEKQMIQGVLDLAERPVRSIMAPRNEVEWLDVSGTQEEMVEELHSFKHSRVVLAHEKIDEFVGVGLMKDLLIGLNEGKAIDWQTSMKQPLVVHENTNVLRVMEQLRHSPVQMAIVVDEHGSFEGIVTPTDLLEAIAGDFADEDEDTVAIEMEEDGSLIVDGYADIRRLSGYLETDLTDDGDRYTTLAGYILWHLGHLPVEGESFEADQYRFEVVAMDRRNIAKVRIISLNQEAVEEELK